MKGRTYRYFQGEPLFPFGYGLSYTKFSYRNLNAPEAVQTGGDVKLSIEVENSGKVAGEEVVQLYVKHLAGDEAAPIRALQGFQRVSLKPGEKKNVEFTVTARQLSSIGKDNRRAVDPGTYELSVGGKQPGFHGVLDAATTEVLTRNIRLTGNALDLN